MRRHRGMSKQSSFVPPLNLRMISRAKVPPSCPGKIQDLIGCLTITLGLPSMPYSCEANHAQGKESKHYLCTYAHIYLHSRIATSLECRLSLVHPSHACYLKIMSLSQKRYQSTKAPMTLLASFPRGKPTSSKKLKEASKGAFRKGAKYHSFFNARRKKPSSV